MKHITVLSDDHLMLTYRSDVELQLRPLANSDIGSNCVVLHTTQQDHEADSKMQKQSKSITNNDRDETWRN